MKRINKLLFPLLLMFVLIGCDDTFEPFGEYEENYSLFCLLDRNTNTQFASIHKNLTPSDFEFDNDINKSFVKNAKIKLITKNNTLLFNDTSFNNEFNVYRLNNFAPLKNQTYSIQAELENGITLSAKILTSNYSFQNVSLVFYQDKFIATWKGNETSVSFLPSIKLNYYNLEKDSSTIISKDFPSWIIKNDKSVDLAYPDFTITNQKVFLLEAVEYMIQNLANEVSKTGFIKIHSLTFTLFVMNKELSSYYNSVNVISNGITFNENPPEYSNISGGKGVFGYKELYKQNIILQINDGYFLSLFRKHGYSF